MNNKFKITIIDITNNKKIISNLKSIRKNNSDVFYFTISHSKLGNIRDLIILHELIKKKKKVIIHYHGGYYRNLYENMNILQREYNRYLLSKVDRVIVLGASLRYLFSGLVPDEKICICENFVEDSSLLLETEFNRKVEKIYKKNKIDVLYLSNFIKSKGYYDVLESAKKFKNQPVYFHFAGKFFENKEFESFKRFIIDNKLENVKYYGIVEGEEKKELLIKCDVFILPTYYHIEGQPISLIEAMANGLTIITTKHAGIPDIVSENNGYIVPPKGINEIQFAIEDLLSNKEKLYKYAFVNREYALSNFKEIDYIKRLEGIFNEV